MTTLMRVAEGAALQSPVLTSFVTLHDGSQIISTRSEIGPSDEKNSAVVGEVPICASNALHIISSVSTEAGNHKLS